METSWKDQGPCGGVGATSFPTEGPETAERDSRGGDGAASRGRPSPLLISGCSESAAQTHVLPHYPASQREEAGRSKRLRLGVGE